MYLRSHRKWLSLRHQLLHNIFESCFWRTLSSATMSLSIDLWSYGKWWAVSAVVNSIKHIWNTSKNWGNNAIHIDGNTALESRSRILVSKLRCIVLVQMRGLEYELDSFSQQQAVVKNGWMNGLIIVQIR